MGDREGLATWRLSVGETGNQFPVSKRKSVENRLVLSIGLRKRDINAIAKHSLWEIAKHSLREISFNNSSHLLLKGKV
jgi:hypothetical protein